MIYKSGQLFKNKAWELQIQKIKKYWQYLTVSLRWTRKSDHAGLRLELEFFGYFLMFTFYDIRHWDDEKDEWFEYDTNKKEII